MSCTARPPFSLRRAQSAQRFPPLLFPCGLHPARSRPLTSPRWPNPASRFLRAQPTQPPLTRRARLAALPLRGATDSPARPRSPATNPGGLPSRVRTPRNPRRPISTATNPLLPILTPAAAANPSRAALQAQSGVEPCAAMTRLLDRTSFAASR